MDKKQGRIEEFNSLRAELLSIYSRRATLENIGTLLFAGMHSIAYTAKIPALSIAANLILLAFFMDDVFLGESIAKIGAYIKAAIEPEIPGLEWETKLTQHEPHRKAGRKLALIDLFSRYPITIIVGIFLAAHNISINEESYSWPFLGQICFVIAELALLIYVIRRRTKFGDVYCQLVNTFNEKAQQID